MRQVSGWAASSKQQDGSCTQGIIGLTGRDDGVGFNWKIQLLLSREMQIWP